MLDQVNATPRSQASAAAKTPLFDPYRNGRVADPSSAGSHVACECVLDHPALVSQLAGRMCARQRYRRPHIRSDASTSRLQLIGLPKTQSNDELSSTR